jgi:competence protein ComEC
MLAARSVGEQVVARSLDGRLPAPPAAEPRGPAAPDARSIAVGDVLRIRGRVLPLGRSDAYQRRRGGHAAVLVESWETTGTRRGGLEGGLDAARARASAALGAGLAPREAALLRGMVLGQDEAIAEETRTAFERSGLAHLIAVSGQNVLLLCVLVLGIGALAGLPLHIRLALAMGVVALYVPLAGAGPSIQRAGVMGVAGLVAALAGRPASRWYALGLAAAVTLAINPATAGEPGWQLSFAAVIGLLALVPPMRDALRRRRVPGPVADALAITTAASLSTGPLLAFHFEEVSVVSLPANLVAAPAVPPLMWLGMLAMTVGQFAPWLAEPLNLLNAPLLAYVDGVAASAAALPLAAVPMRLHGPVGLGVAYAALGGTLAALVWAWRAHGRRFADRACGRHRAAGWASASAIAGIALLVLVAGRPSPSTSPRPGELVVSFLDVGQGDATLLQLDGAAILVDTGPPGGPVLRRLDQVGVKRLDVLVLTHAQSDHEGMALPILQRYRPRLVLNGGAGWSSHVQRALGPASRDVGTRTASAALGQVLQVGRIRMRILWPPAPPPGWQPSGDANQRALVAHVSVGDFDLLLPADAESDVLASLPLPRIEALKVSHHGSVDDGLPRLLERLTPSVAAIEVGARNTYGHPAPSTLAALRVVRDVVRTDQDGNVRLRVASRVMRIERF